MANDLSAVMKPGNVAVLRITADHMKEVSFLCKAMITFAEQSQPEGFVINLAGVRLVPSELLSTFVLLHRRAPNTVKLCHVHPNIVETLTRTQLIQLFNVCEDEGVALARLRNVAAEAVADAETLRDLVSTVYHALGIPENQTLPDIHGRPQFICPGKPIRDLFS